MTSHYDTQQAVCNALKVPRGTRSIDIRLAFDEATTVKIEYYPDDLDALIPVLKTLVLVAKDAPDIADAPAAESWERGVTDVSGLLDVVRRYQANPPNLALRVRAALSNGVERVKRWVLR